MEPLGQVTRLAVGGVAAVGLGAALTFLATGLTAATVVTVILVAVFVAAAVRFAVRRAGRTETPYW
ncbi:MULTISPECIES: hypothetical protein [Haloprofundus]|uniref:hypothetical protein n=1 Tax=Haloprofundus TaxID=1911573 RepID=UPI000E453640|nr:MULTISPECIES: hypothetical protein [Haloprofundus]QCJ46496.1 hypothetical protein FCF25_04920 [Haloprofundus sp. MHR1]